MARPRIIVLGAGLYQVPLINKAKEMGCETYVVSIPGNYPGFDIADHVSYLDTRDADGVLSLARKEQVSGIVTTGTDVAVRTIGYVCDALGLPGVSEHAALTLTDKALMKQVFAGRVSTSPFRIVHDLVEARWAAEELGFPVMVKACDVSGSRGVTRVDSMEGLEGALGSSIKASHTAHYVVERCVEGTEIGVDAFVTGGKVQICLPHDKAVWRNGGVTIPSGHSFPFGGGNAVEARVRHEIDALVAAAGLDDCALNADAMVCADGSVSIIEAGARCGATCIPELIQLHTGIDYYAQIIRCALGEGCDFTPKRDVACAARLLFARSSGIVRGIDEECIAGLNTDRVQVSLDVRVGDSVQEAHDGTDRIGQVIVSSLSAGEMNDILRKAEEALTIE